MRMTVLTALFAVMLVCAPVYGVEKSRKSAAKKKVETGAMCKAPAVGPCAACSITCRPGETATCASGQAFGDACHIQPSCKCSR